MTSIECPKCQQAFDVTARPETWTGEIRTELHCPNCAFVFRWKYLPAGAYSSKAKTVLLRNAVGGCEVYIDDYDISTQQCEDFARTWRSVWARLPASVTSRLESYWSCKNGEPHVWLTNDRTEWRGTAWAASVGGKSLYFLASLVTEATLEILETAIAHELAHAVCSAVGEENHVSKTGEDDIRIKQEWIVWRLIESWGFNQSTADIQIEINFQDDGFVFSRREKPLTTAPSETSSFTKRQEYEQRLQGFKLPSKVREFLG